jgi:hypothetical protein
MLLRILYFSTAHADLTAAEVDAIVSHSVQANAARDVTGALAFNGRNFCQLLEGDEQVVRDLIAKISTDKRHSGFKVIDEKLVQDRAFPGWAMQRVRDLDFSVVINAMTR